MADERILPPTSSGGPEQILGPPPLAGGSAQGGFSFTAIVAALQTIGRGLFAIQQVINNNFVNLSANNVFTGTNTFNALVTFASRAIFQSGENHKVRVAITSPVTVTTADFIVATNLTVAGAVAVSLPATPAKGDYYVVKDARGDGSTHNITITPAAGTIDGSATSVISTNYGVNRLVYNGSEWSLV